LCITTPLIPFTGKGEARETEFSPVAEIEVCIVEGKNPAKRGSAKRLINAI
jgi:hypothetical protein